MAKQIWFCVGKSSQEEGRSSQARFCLSDAANVQKAFFVASAIHVDYDLIQSAKLPTKDHGNMRCAPYSVTNRKAVAESAAFPAVGFQADAQTMWTMVTG
eukprot:scaffold2234_cov151-Cylindrotheca_fusiformis.AAC.5